MSELSRSYSFIMPFLILMLLKTSSKLSERDFFQLLLFALLILSVANFLLSILPKLTFYTDNLVVLYGEGKVYNEGYARYRAFGIIGQPGKAGIFSVISTMIALLHLRIYSNNKIIVYVIVFFSLISASLTLSRTALILILSVIIFFGSGFKLKLFLYAMIFFVFSYVLFLEPEYFKMLSRGFDLESGNYSTASHRLVSKLWALDTISDHWITVLFGVGDSKEYMSQFSHPYAFDLSLRTPDSTQTVWMLRYGLLGMLVAYAPIIYIFSLNFKSIWSDFSFRNMSIKLFPIGIVILLSLVDPMFHDAKINILNSILFMYVFQLILREKYEKSIGCRT
ncbi:MULTISPECIES: O-antigen ligase family protein [Marinomonas]|uniref:O-antigen ligase family protein n=1 Tax=Marinomonas rhodophyticola TaxID=2992803 RepID=A0ABT3KLI3_9GAMM|nr:O-antigen ligase family protein [Marinomonas sp. KJ51-3]MCW4631006.1 O-antigen ligase family protein [Marinomonas sp. KJ51-3]